MRLFSFCLPLILWGLTATVVDLTEGPPAPKGTDVASSEFSAERAFVLLQRLLPNGEAHPTGSPSNVALRDRILAHYSDIGYEAEVQRVKRQPSGQTVENIIARLPGQTPGPAAMIVAHYDSVAEGPGISDDLSGVAIVLEAARIFRNEPAPHNPVVFLITDGEEQGLWGAEAFVRQHPLARSIGVAVNLEARGTCGRSLMFQTSDDSAWLVAAYAKSVEHPDTASIYREVYRRLPNDTDLTVFHNAGVPGINLAFIGNAACYHTAKDDLAHLDLGTLQHEGDNAIGAIRAFADMDLIHPKPGRAVYTDLLGWTVVRWPEEWTPAIAILAAIAFCLATWRLMRCGVLSRSDCLWGGMAAPFLCLTPALVAFGITRLPVRHLV